MKDLMVAVVAGLIALSGCGPSIDQTQTTAQDATSAPDPTILVCRLFGKAVGGIAENRDHGIPLNAALDQATQSGSSDPYWPRAVAFVYAHPELNHEAVEASWDERCLSGND
jgi:hypothetical protein